MRVSGRGLCPAIALGAALSVVLVAAPMSSPARSEIQLELGDLLFADERYYEAISVYDRAKEGADPGQLERASSGLLRSLLYAAEFNRAYEEALFLQSLDPSDPELRTLSADGLWSYGLFDEAAELYQDILATTPSSGRARHGLARSLAARNLHEQALTEIRAAIASRPLDPVLHYTLGQILRGLNRYGEAAEALERHVEMLPNVRESDQVSWTRSEASFLRAFGDRVPFEMPRDADVVHTLPFRLINEKIVVSGRINGRDPVDLVVDTGAEQMVLSQETADYVGLRAITMTISAGVGAVGVRGLDLGLVDSLEIGSFEVRNLPSLIKNPPLTMAGMPSSRVADSISPLAFGLSTIIDYRNQHLILSKSLPDDPADVELPMRINRLAVVRGVINGDHPKSFVVDTGGEVISISLGAFAALRIRVPHYIPLRVFGTSGWDEDAFLLPGIDLAFNEIEYDNFPVVVLNLHKTSALAGFHIGGILGYEFLRHYRVSMDLERAVLKLTRY